MQKLGKSENLSAQVLERIQKSIIAREYQPGTLLPSEKEMSELYGVGKSSVREAIKMLQVLGVAESAQGKGTYLRKSLGPQILKPLMYDMMLQQSTAQELYEMRVMFDTACHALATQKATEEDKARARARYMEYRGLFEANLPVADADTAFHRCILEATRNQLIVTLGTLIMELCAPYMDEGNAIYDREVMESHGELLEIFCSGDTSKLPEAIEHSLLVFKSVMKEHYEHTD